MSKEPIGFDSAYTIAFSVDHREPNPGDVSRNAYFAGLFRRIPDLLDGEWEENTDAYDTAVIEKANSTCPRFSDRDEDFRAAANLLIGRLCEEVNKNLHAERERRNPQ